MVRRKSILRALPAVASMAVLVACGSDGAFSPLEDGEGRPDGPPFVGSPPRETDAGPRAEDASLVEDAPARPNDASLQIDGSSGEEGGSVPGGETDGAAPGAGDSGGDAGTDGGANGGDGPAPVGGGALLPIRDGEASCSGLGSLGPDRAVGLADAALVRLVAVSSDERTVVWAEDAPNGVRVFHGERDASDEPFRNARRLNADAFALDEGAALTPDGLRVVFVAADRKRFVELARPNRNAAFSPAQDDRFAALNFHGSVVLPIAQRYGDPLFSSDGAAFVYSVHGGGLVHTVHVATLVDGGFALGEAWSDPLLVADDFSRKRPTALSADHRTLVFWDEALGRTRGGFRGSAQGTLERIVDLDARKAVRVNAGCTAVYFTRDAQRDVLFANVAAVP